MYIHVTFMYGEIIMQTSIRTWGNSQGLCIPKYMLRQLGWGMQEDVEITIRGESILIEKARPAVDHDVKAEPQDGLPKRAAEYREFAAQYADPELIKKEKDAFRIAMVKKYGHGKDTD